MEELKNQLSQAIDYRRRCLIDCIVGGERGILDKLKLSQIGWRA